MTIVGVNPPGFTGAYSAQASPDVFLPFSMERIVAPTELSDGQETLLENRSIWWVLVMGRRKPGVKAATADAAFNVGLHAAVRATDDGETGQPERRDLCWRTVAGDRIRMPTI